MSHTGYGREEGLVRRATHAGAPSRGHNGKTGLFRDSFVVHESRRRKEYQRWYMCCMYLLLYLYGEIRPDVTHISLPSMCIPP